MFQSIIVPLDGSNFGDFALPYAIALARRAGATLKLVHVHDPTVPGEALEANPHFQFQRVVDAHRAADESKRISEAERLSTLADALAAEGIAATADVLTGRVADAVSGFAAGASNALIVMTTHGLSGFQRFWLGSVADAVVRQSSTPVLLVRRTSEAQPLPENVQFHRILVPVDGSSFSTSIVEPIAAVVGSEQVKVTFFEAAVPDDSTVSYSPLWPIGLADNGPAAKAEFLRELVGDLPDNLHGAEVKQVAHAQPALAILDEAETGSYDLIAMATHGFGGAHHLLLGSTADKVMRGTHKPLLLYRPKGVRWLKEIEKVLVAEEIGGQEAVLAD